MSLTHSKQLVAPGEQNIETEEVRTIEADKALGISFAEAYEKSRGGDMAAFERLLLRKLAL